MWTAINTLVNTEESYGSIWCIRKILDKISTISIDLGLWNAIQKYSEASIYLEDKYLEISLNKYIKGTKLNHK